MGRLVGSLAAEYGCDVAGIIDPQVSEGREGPDSDRWRDVDVAIDFSSPDAVAANLETLAKRGINIVVGTTGWHKDEPSVRQAAADARIGVVAAPNFSTGMVLFEEIIAQAASLFAPLGEFGVWLHEAHHAAKKDAPSGTALQLKQTIEQSGVGRAIDVAWTRAGSIPGTHTIGFDGPAESVTLSHIARDRTGFARGALTAARWVQGKRGWFTMRDVLGLQSRTS